MPPQGNGRRLSSRVVTLGMLSSLSLALVACSTEDTTTASCVDSQAGQAVETGTGTATGTGAGAAAAAGDFGTAATPAPVASQAAGAGSGDTRTVVDDSYCDTTGTSSYTRSAHRYYWYYGGHSYYSGGRRLLSGGTTIRPYGSRIRTSGGHSFGGGHSVSRGGFGGHGHGGS